MRIRQMFQMSLPVVALTMLTAAFAPAQAAVAAPQDSDSEFKRSFGAMRAATDNENATSFYLVPMKGIMGTDINIDVYRKMVDDIREHNPDYMIIVLNSKDIEEGIDDNFEVIESEEGYGDIDALDMYREIVTLFRTELGDIPQVMWVHDSEGISTVLALAWPEIYIQSEGDFGGIAKYAVMFERVKSHENMYGKFREALMGIFKGFAEYGNQPLQLVDAMVRPEYELSATWKGREVLWSLDTNGEAVIDETEEATVSFDAKTAEDFLVVDGIADTLDDLALTLGIREYRVLDGNAEKIFDEEREAWRRAWDRVNDSYAEYVKYMSWEQNVANLSRAKRQLEQILSLMRRYSAVKLRLAVEFGITEFLIQTYIEQIEENIRALVRNNNAGRGGGGMGGPGRGRGGAGR